MEDDAALAERTRDTLRSIGFEVDLASNGEGGLIMHRLREYDVLIIAQEMPVKSGIDVVWALAAKNELPPAIMVAAQGDAQVAVQALKLGVGDYLLKDAAGSFINLLPGTIQTVIEKKRVEAEKDHLLEAFQEAQTQLQKTNRALLELAAMDGLTGIANRRLFNEVLEREWRNGMESGQPLSLILTDVDYFKRYNDIYGHLAGDDCLKRVAQVIGQAAESSPILAARYGGEEFALVLPNHTSSAAGRVADALRRGVEGLGIAHQASAHDGIVTISLGVVTRIPSGDSTPAALIESADSCLYRAKEAGRNWVAAADLSRRASTSASTSGPFRDPLYR